MTPDYATHSRMSDPGRHRALFCEMPGSVADAARAVQGLCLHDFVAESFYGCPVPQQRSDEIHIRPVEALVDRLLDMDDRPLTEARPKEKRLAIRCRHYALLHIAALREKGVPARMRGGFAAYFNPPFFEDHWITEYWNAERSRWTLVDPQLDQVWMQKLGHRDDPLDLSRHRFIVAAEAWRMCRDGRADPKKFGIGVGELRGLWFVASSLIRDLAALNKAEMLPWDVWGAQPKPETELTGAELAYFDRIAEVTGDPDRPAAEYAALYEGDARLRVGETVFNALTQRMEPVKATQAA